MRYIILTALFMLTGCEQSQSASSTSYSGYVSVFTDTNGCQYLVWDGYNAGSIIPRYNITGQQICGAK